MILHKGPEVAAHYPDPILRDFGDVDLIVRNAEEVQRALIAAGFEEIGDPALYVDIQHLRPLRWPELPLRVEIHSRPKWVEALPGPSTEELFAAAVPSTATIDGFLALPPQHHALVLAAHSWATSRCGGSGTWSTSRPSPMRPSPERSRRWRARGACHGCGGRPPVGSTRC